MKACILAAGDGTRMWPLTEGRPKPLLPVVDRPIIVRQVELLKEVGIEEIHILLGHLSGEITQALGNGERWGVEINYHYQKERLGTAHAVGIFREAMDKSFLCINGDVLIGRSALEDLLKFFKRRKGMTVAIKEVADPTQFGVIEVEGERVVKLHEKPESPPSNLVNAGVYIFTPEIFSYIERTPLSPRGEYEITDTLQMLSSEGKLYGMEIKGFWMDVATPWDLLEANETLIKDISGEVVGTVEEGVQINGKVYVGAEARVRSGTYIEGPVYIGEGCDVGPNAYLRAGTVLVRNVRVGAASEVKNSIIMEGSKVPHHNYVGDSVIGRECNLGSGTKVANLRHDGKSVTVVLKGRRVDTGRRKFGVVLGDGVKTGINTTLNVGTLLGRGCITYPGARVSGTYLSGSVIR